MFKYLEENGLEYFWTKLKAYFAKKSEVLHLTGGTMTGAINGTAINLSGDISADNATFTGDIEAGDMALTGNIEANDITLEGDISADNATFTGDISADNATFTGDISADNATFTGDISADNATLSGDISANDATLSGDIEAVRFTSNDRGFAIDLPTVEADTVPAATQYLHGLEFVDKNDLFLGGVQFIDNTSSNFQGIQVGISKSDWNQQLLMFLGLCNDQDHSPYIRFTHPRDFIDALSHDGSSGRGSYVQYTGSDVVDLNSTYATLVSATVIRWGRLVWLRIIYTNKTTWSIGANGDTSNITIGKLKHFPPVEGTNLPSVGDIVDQALKPYINSVGDITIIGGDATGAAYTVGANLQQIMNVCYMSKNNPGES